VSAGPDRDAERRGRLLRWLRLGLFVLVVLGVVIAIPATSLGRYLEYAEFEALVARAGAWAPVLFIAVFTIGTVFIAPASLMSFAAVAVFGTGWGLVWVTLATNLCASAAFAVGRWAGRDAVAALASSRRRAWVERIGEMLERSGLMTVLVLRMVFSPFNLVNYIASVTRLRYRDYVVGTFFGMFPVVFVWVFLGDVLAQVWKEGDLRPLWSGQSLVVALVFVVCLGIPLILRKRGRLS
jgi:uncharacterized membrane protein YdjX (TVP38/TMEM64 family)